MSVAPERVAAQAAAQFPTPFELGMRDAQDGEICCPEVYFRRRADCAEYCLGFEHVKPGQLATCYYVHKEALHYV